MTDGQMAFEFGQIIFPENLGYETHRFVGPDIATIRRNDTGAFLPPVLKGEETKKGQPGRFRMPIDGKNAAFLPGSACIQIISISHWH
jgi:hypothetical protein